MPHVELALITSNKEREMDATATVTQREDTTTVLSRETILTYLLHSINKYLRDSGIYEVQTPTDEAVTDRKEFLYKSWVLATREVDTSPWAGAVVDGGLVVKSNISVDACEVVVECDDSNLCIVDIEDGQQFVGSPTFSVVVTSTGKVQLDLDANGATGLFCEICLEVLRGIATLASHKKLIAVLEELNDCENQLAAQDISAYGEAPRTV